MGCGDGGFWAGVVALSGLAVLVLRHLWQRPTREEQIRKRVTYAHTNIQKARSQLQNRDMEGLRETLDRQDMDLSVLRGMLSKSSGDSPK